MLASGLIMVGCDKKNKNVEPTPDPTPAPTPDPTPDPGPDPGPGPGPTVVHQDPFVRDVAAGTALREYKADFDAMIDDFSGENLNGELTGGARNEGLLRVLVDSENGDYPNSPDASIYKQASAAFYAAHPDVVGFKMRKVGDGTLGMKDLIFGSRGDDTYNVYEINMADALDSDNEALPELTNEWQDFEIDFNNTIEDETTEYTLAADGSATGVRVLDAMKGFHLYAKADANVSQVIEIKEVYTKKGAVKTVVDAFQHPQANKNTDFECWWSDSTGFIVRRGINLKNASYTVAVPAAAQAMENLVLELNGSGAGLKVNNTDVTLAPVNGGFHDFVVNLTDAGLTLGSELTISSTSDLNVSAIFASNLQEKAAATEYPVIDIQHRAVFDDFGRTQATFTGDWDIASTADYTPDGISVALSYSQPELVSAHDGSLHITQPASGYVNVKEANAVAENPLQYLVIVAKGNLEGFRLGSADVMWSHDWLAAPGLKSIPEDLDNYPYKSGEFVHYIIDLQEMGSDIGRDAFIDMYFNNAIEIDSIYFARKAATYGDDEVNLNAAPNLSTYSYLGWISLENAYEIDLHIEGTGSLHSLRLEGDEEYWFKDEKVKGMDGQPIDDTLTFDNEHPLNLRIPVALNGWTEGGLHLHAGGFDGSTGAITAISYVRLYADPWRVINTVGGLNQSTPDDYSYIGWFSGEGPVTVVELSMYGAADGATLQTLRLEGDTAKWLKDGALLDEEGNAIAVGAISSDSTAPTVLRIDLAKSFPGYAGGYHIHFGDGEGDEVAVTFAAKTFVPFTAAYEIAIYNA